MRNLLAALALAAAVPLAPAARADDTLAQLAELLSRIEQQRAATPAPAARRALMLGALARYRDRAALLGARGRGAEAWEAAELARSRMLLDLSAARFALDAGPLPAVKLAALEELRTPSVEELRRLLPPESAYLGYFSHGGTVLLFAVSPELGGLLHRVPAPPRLSASIAAWRFLLAIPGEWREKIARLPRVWRRADGSFQVAAAAPEPGAARVEDEAEIASYLGEKLLAPAAGHLARARRVIVSPDADLAFLPFEALRLGRRHLVESHDVHYTAAAGLYALSRERAASRSSLPDRAGLLSLGGALYEAYVQVTPLLNVHHELLYGAPRTSRGPAAPRTVPDAFRALKVTWANLPGTGEEAARIAALFEGSRALVGPEASEERLLQLNASGELGRYRHLYFATHGYLSPYDPRLSSVVLSQVRNKGAHDGYVTAAEWPRYDLASDLVFIAAANSGFGPVAAAEGLLGLPFALHVAGNHNTVVSLWTLNDPATAALVERFFSLVREGADPVRALAGAKREQIAAGRAPSYWAPFVLHGS